MTAHLKGRDLWSAISNPSQSTEATIQRAFSELVASLTDEMVFTIIEKETPKDVWDSLQSTCRARHQQTEISWRKIFDQENIPVKEAFANT